MYRYIVEQNVKNQSQFSVEPSVFSVAEEVHSDMQ